MTLVLQGYMPRCRSLESRDTSVKLRLDSFMAYLRLPSSPQQDGVWLPCARFADPSESWSGIGISAAVHLDNRHWNALEVFQ